MGTQFGSTISKSIEYAINQASKYNDTVEFEFNGVTIQVCTDSDPDLIYRDWNRAMNGYIERLVGPYPKIVLSKEDIENDDQIRHEQNRLAEIKRAEAAKLHNEKVVRVIAKTIKTKPVVWKDETAYLTWKQNNEESGYALAIFRYAEQWALLMTYELSQGHELTKDVIETTAMEADLEGITGYMQSAAKSILQQMWEHGDKLL